LRSAGPYNFDRNFVHPIDKFGVTHEGNTKDVRGFLRAISTHQSLQTLKHFTLSHYHPPKDEGNTWLQSNSSINRSSRVADLRVGVNGLRCIPALPTLSHLDINDVQPHSRAERFFDILAEVKYVLRSCLSLTRLLLMSKVEMELLLVWVVSGQFQSNTQCYWWFKGDASFKVNPSWRH
jgi:hypothetical protein